MSTAAREGGYDMTGGRRGFTLIEIMIVIAIISILILLLLPNYVRARSRSRLTACETSLRNMATASEMYAYENANLYATSLVQLTPKYLQSIPKCPSAPDNTGYINGFSSASTPVNIYTLSCSGAFHSDLGLPSNYPMYVPNVGMMEH